jgi:transcriptional regulator with XRE-family HTH domain
VSARHRSALAEARRAAGYTQEDLAEALHVDRSTVVRWDAGDHEPLPYLRPKLARLLGRSMQQLQDVIDCTRSKSSTALPDEVEAACRWLDERVGWRSGTARRRVADGVLRRAGSVDVEVLGRAAVDDTLADYYGAGSQYRVDVGGQVLRTSIATRDEWLGIGCELTAAGDLVVLSEVSEAAPVEVDGDAAVRRLVEVAADGVRLADQPIYRLIDVAPGQQAVRGSVAPTSLIEYALTLDLLERELLGGDATALRDRYLPDLASVFDVGGRLCAGGALALCAIARPADPYRGPADYLVLVQERSAEVLNGAGRLSVIPKGFHGPLSDERADARISATVRRELEEELFGRPEVDHTTERRRIAAPMHPSRLSEPMRWLDEQPGRLRLECTGFGLNLVSGNYEFACLALIEDDEFWTRFGGAIEANWEAAGLRTYSTLDGELIERLTSDDRWTNEGLFAFTLGLRRLQEIGGARVDLLRISWSLV